MFSELQWPPNPRLEHCESKMYLSSILKKEPLQAHVGNLTITKGFTNCKENNTKYNIILEWLDLTGRFHTIKLSIIHSAECKLKLDLSWDLRKYFPQSGNHNVCEFSCLTFLQGYHTKCMFLYISCFKKQGKSGLQPENNCVTQ